MTQIHGLIFIAVGALVSIVSISVGNPKLILFIFAGIAIVIYGVIKLIFQYVHHHSESAHPQHKQNHQHHQHQSHQTQHFQDPQSQPAQQQMQPRQRVYRCNKCNGPVYETFRFCPHCGSPLK